MSFEKSIAISITVIVLVGIIVFYRSDYRKDKIKLNFG
jgi:hypothetical protein